MVAGQILFKSMPMTRLALNRFLFNPLGFEEKDIMCLPVLVSGLRIMLRIFYQIIISTRQASSQMLSGDGGVWIG